ncbi:hypothetical protein [Flaviaesturariibacter amylovorans]|uniref:Uncharacterized protein n=1 Tax=Flaviaesturariibacter amylovorans TaxID=1084520 RepID=A0ABP8GR33_9BACT
MIPLTQTKFSLKNAAGEWVQHGNCWATAIASILELPLSEVPNFEVWYEWEDGLWWYLTDRFLLKKGMKLDTDHRFRVFHMTEAEWECFGEAIDAKIETPEHYYRLRVELKHEYYFVSGLSARGVSHVTIWKNGVMVHDPHPSRDGILELTRFEYIRPLTDEERYWVNHDTNHFKVAFPCSYEVKPRTVK